MNRRIWADEVEKNIVDEINGLDTGFEYAKLAAQKLHSEIDIKKAEWTGSNNYDETGDIKITTNYDKKVFI